MADKRDGIRTPMVTRIRITCDSMPEFIAKTRDISDCGVFIVMDGGVLPAVGSVVQGQVLDLPVDDAPLVDMEVVRVEPGGIGLRFL